MSIYLKITNVAIVSLIIFTANAAYADVSARWNTPLNDTQALAKEVLDKSNIITDLSTLVKKHFKSSSAIDIENLSIKLTTSGTPTVNTSKPELILPYDYITQAIKAQAELEETQEDALDRGFDLIEYTLYHLLGHLLSGDPSPDADDQAEALSTWLMIKSWPNGGEQWHSDARAFGRASQLLDGSLQDYWHAHSLYKSRQAQINCWILGSNPEQYEPLLKQVLEPEKRRTKCIAAWQTLNTSSLETLAPLLKENSTLRQTQ